MDLLSALPEDIFNEVVSYLNGFEILNALSVSKEWNQRFGQSNHCMQKIAIKYNKYRCNKDANPLLKSNRKYQNIIIEFEDENKIETDVKKKIKEILKKFSNSIVTIETTHDFQRIYKLPKLKELKCSFWKNNIFPSGLLTTCQNVTKLKLYCFTSRSKHLSIIHDGFKNMKKLKELYLNDVGALKNIKNENCKFKLEKFHCGMDGCLSDCFDFLKHHQSTLKDINVELLEPEDVQFILRELPKLQTFRIQLGCSDYEWDVPENSTVKKIILSDCFIDSNGQQNMANIFLRSKNLQQITLETIYPCYLSAFVDCQSLILVKYRHVSNKLTEDQKHFLNDNQRIKFIRTY